MLLAGCDCFPQRTMLALTLAWGADWLTHFRQHFLGLILQFLSRSDIPSEIMPTTRFASKTGNRRTWCCFMMSAACSISALTLTIYTGCCSQWETRVCCVSLPPDTTQTIMSRVGTTSRRPKQARHSAANWLAGKSGCCPRISLLLTAKPFEYRMTLSWRHSV